LPLSSEIGRGAFIWGWLAKFAEAHAKKQLFRIQIDSATTQEELDNIKWNI